MPALLVRSGFGNAQRTAGTLPARYSLFFLACSEISAGGHQLTLFAGAANVLQEDGFMVVKPRRLQ
jgi:hypothetical protein